MEHLEFIAGMTFPIPEKSQVRILYHSVYSNANRSKNKRKENGAKLMFPIARQPSVTRSEAIRWDWLWRL
jgi:hypothetical protein